MKKLTKVASVLVLAATLTACGGSKSKDNKKEVEKLKENLHGIYLNLDNLDCSKFSLTYEKDDDSDIYSDTYFDDLEKVKINYDETGYLYYYSYTEENKYSLDEVDEKELVESYAWVEGSVFTYSWYQKDEINWENPTKMYRVTDYGSHEDAMDAFNDYIESYDMLDTTAIDYILTLNDQHLELMEMYAEARVNNSTNKMEFKINKNDSLSVDFKITENYSEKNDEGNVWNSSDSTWTMVVEDGYVTSYIKSEDRFVNPPVGSVSDSVCKETYTFAKDWTWEEPDLSTYHQYN